MSARHHEDLHHDEAHAEESAGHNTPVGGEGHDDHNMHGHDDMHAGGADVHEHEHEGHDEGHDEAHDHSAGSIQTSGTEDHASEQGKGGPHHHV